MKISHLCSTDVPKLVESVDEIENEESVLLARRERHIRLGRFVFGPIARESREEPKEESKLPHVLLLLLLEWEWEWPSLEAGGEKEGGEVSLSNK